MRVAVAVLREWWLMTLSVKSTAYGDTYVVVTATTVEVTLVVNVLPLESVVAIGTTTGVAAPACAA